jgi:predicted DNA-binding ribbon-helix-helix protein
VNLKRSFSLAGHRTSVALEADFWRALEEMAEARAVSLAALVREIDAERKGENLASACRRAALAYYRRNAALP